MRSVEMASGFQTAAQGLGCMGMSEFYGPTNDAESITTIHHALDLGITMLDTADMYGVGHNEELVGRAVRGRRDEVRIATKFGIVRDADDPTLRGFRGDRAYVRQACESSLRRLGIDTIDLYYMHRRDENVPVEETVGAMAELVAEGKVRYLGLSEVTGSEVRRAHDVHPITAVQSEWSVWSRDVEDDVVPACRELSIGFVPYSPLGRGFLTGAVTSTADLTAADFRHHQPRFEPANAARNRQALTTITEIAESHGTSASRIALAWSHCQASRWGIPVVPIPGTKRVRWLEENVGALDVVLGDDDLTRLDGIVATISGDRYADMTFTSAGGRP